MVWDRFQLNEVLTELRRQRGDSTEVEVKRARGGLPKNLSTTICAFANMPEGGDVILGVDEATDFSITGVENVAELKRGVVNQTRAAVDPPPFLEFSTIDVEGVTVLVVHVRSLPPKDRPAYCGGQAYLRQADGDYVMSGTDLSMLEVAKYAQQQAQNYDMEPITGSSKADLDPRLVKMFIAEVRATSVRLRNEQDDEILRLKGVTTAEGELTLAGLYAMGKYPQGPKPALTVTAAVQLPRDESSHGARTQNLRHFDGPIPDLLSDIMDWISQNLSTSQIYDGTGNLRDVLELPMRGIREAVANALVHRDLGPNTLGVGKQVEVRIDPQKLMIKNPGGLQGVTVSRLESEELVKQAVNQRLYAITRDLRTSDGARIIEGEGAGVREILLSARERGLHRPKLVDTGLEFKALLWRGARFTEEQRAWLSSQTSHRLSPIQESILLSLRDGKNWTPESVHEHFAPISIEAATEQLSQLQRWGLIDVDLSRPEESRLLVPASVPHDMSGAPSRDKIDIPGKNGPIVYAALQNGARSIADLVTATKLSPAQVRHSLNTLMPAGLVRRTGGQGHRDTTYHVV